MDMSSISKALCRGFTAIAIPAFLLAGCATSATGPQVRRVDDATAKRLDGGWVALIGEDHAFPFNGEYRDSKANSGYQMLYPAPNFVGFLAGVATHAALQSAQNDAQIEERRKVSDEVLQPFRQVLSEIQVHDVFKRALRLSKSGSEISVANRSSGMALPEVELAAHAIMAQSRRALIVDLVAKIKDSSLAANNADASGYVHKVRVISDPMEVRDNSVDDYWLADDGHQLKQTVARLLARAIDLFVTDATRHLRPVQEKQITARYQFGNEHRTERVVLLERTCARQTLRTLRGWVLSVPVLDSRKAEADCKGTEVAGHREVPPA